MMIRIVLAALTISAFAEAQQPSLDREAALGARLADSMRQQTRVLDSPSVQRYVSGLGERLRRHMADPNRAFAFTVVADAIGGSTSEPFALPGGYIFVPAGLIVQSRSEDELAGMLAHAMAHVADGHRQIINQGTVPLVFVGGWSGDATAVPVKFLPIRREAELRADRDAVIVMHAAGYDPQALLNYIDRVQRDPNADFHSALPDCEVRIESLRAAIRPLSTVNGVGHP